MQLNANQLAASKFKNGIASVVAVPGSGKTLTMTNRIAYLIQHHGIAPESILGLTFTRNAAQAMRDKLRPMLNDVAARVTLSTIHSFCYTVLKDAGKSFELLHGKEQIRFIRIIMKKHKIRTLSPGTILREISLAKNNIIGAEEFREIYLDDPTMEIIGVIYQAYEEEKTKSYLLDFNDLIIEVCRLLKNTPEIREKYQQTFRHILVDEFQDTNPAQAEILNLLVGKSKDCSFYVTGDDWQSIFNFIGASVGNLLNFKKTFPGSEQFILDMNYRSTPQILTACFNLIQHNVRKIEKSLLTQNPDGQAVLVIDASNEDDEAIKIAQEIQGLVSDKFTHHDIAILYRANSQSRVIEDVFSQNDIPYHIENGMTFYQRREVKILLDYLRLIHDPGSVVGDDALKNVINAPNRYMGKKFMAELEDFAMNENHNHLYDALKRKPVAVPYLKHNIREFIKLIDSLMHKIKNAEPAEMIMMLRETLDYDRWISEDDIPSPDDNLIANLNELQIAASKYKDIPTFLNYTDSFKEQNRNDKEGVSLMTIHKSKGLEFPVVFCIGFVDGVMPNVCGDIEEERRIAFVGVSRAMKLLFLSHTTTRMGRSAKQSPFLDEILGNK
jgi:DNA helicase-2/ATP-dependent DNA helicase PcrA